MKTTTNINCKPFALVAALASLLLCSCASTDLLQKQAFLGAQFNDESDHNNLSSPREERIAAEYDDVVDQIAQQRAESTAMFFDVAHAVLQSLPAAGCTMR